MAVTFLIVASIIVPHHLHKQNNNRIITNTEVAVFF